MRNLITSVRENLIRALGGYTLQERNAHAERRLAERDRVISARIRAEIDLIRAGKAREPNIGFILSGVDS